MKITVLQALPQAPCCPPRRSLSFQSGIYLDYAVSGNVLITFTRQAGTNAVLSGLFLDPTTTPAATPTAAFLKQDTTQGTGIGTYGINAYDAIGGIASLPADDTATPEGQSTWTWTTSNTDSRAAQEPRSSGRFAIRWKASSSSTMEVALSGGQSHDLEL